MQGTVMSINIVILRYFDQDLILKSDLDLLLSLKDDLEQKRRVRDGEQAIFDSLKVTQTSID